MSELERFLTTVRPELVLLQEVALIEGQPQTEAIAGRLGYSSHYLAAGTWAGQVEGLAILTLGQSAVVASSPLSPAPGEIDRAALIVELTGVGHGRIHALTTHLAYRPEHSEQRARQAQECRELLERTTRERGAEAIVGADLNEHHGAARAVWLDSSALGLLELRESARHHDHAPSFDYDNPWTNPDLAIGRNLDYLFASRTLGAEWCTLALCGHDGWGPVSDHYGLLASIKGRSSSC